MSRHDEPEPTRRKKRKGRRSDRAARTAPLVLVPPRPDRPAGQRLYDMPFSSASPRLIKPELGLHNLVARAGEHAAYEIDVTLLDAPDHRLIRSGVLLAHRVVDGRGEWFLTAPDWQPLLPKDRIELMGDADLPDALASLIRPLRRRATLGPVAGLRCDRREFALRDDHGTTLALLRDDKVTVRRGGLTTARYREVMVTPVGPGLDEEQRAFLERAFVNAGANRVQRFPRLVTRLGAPATGPSDIPETLPYDAEASFRRFVAAVVGRRLREIVRCDLAVRGGNLAAGTRLGEQAAALRADLLGLADGVDPDWAEDIVEDMDWLVAAAADLPHRVSVGPDGSLSVRLRSERYLSLLERLVSAARVPRLRVDGSEPAGPVLTRLLAAATEQLRAVADAIGPDDDAEAWAALRACFERHDRLAELVAELAPGESLPAERRLRRSRARLDAVRADRIQVVPDVNRLSAEEAFRAGRVFERSLESDRRLRQDFVETWAKASRKL